MKNAYISILFVLFIFLHSCRNTSFEELNRSSEQKNNPVEKDLIMSFKTKSELDSYLKSGCKSLEYNFYNSTDRNILKSSNVDSIIEEHKKLVPDIYISKLLSPKGEIIVNDTIYRVTKNGRFLCCCFV